MTQRPLTLILLSCLFGFVIAKADTFLVLPFFNISNSQNLDWVGESVSETIREALASEGMIVLDRQDRDEAYHRLAIRPYCVLTHASIVKIGDTLDADRIIYGQFKVTEPDTPGLKRTLTLTARVLNSKQLKQSQEFFENGSLDDLAVLQTRLAWELLRYVRPASTVTEEEFRKRHPSVRVDALEYYIRGLLASTPELKHRYFTQAVRLDARFSQPCFQLGRLQWEKKNYHVAADWLARVDAADLHYHEANFLLGLCRYNLGDFKGAVESFQSVAAAVPLNEVLNDLGASQSRLDEKEAVDTFRKALEGDPTDPVYHFNLGYTLWKQGKFAEAAGRFRAVLDRVPDDNEAKMMLGRCLNGNGPKPNEVKGAGLERLKFDYEESAYRQLKEVLAGKD